MASWAWRPDRAANELLSATERALAESNERYRSLFAFSPHAAFSLDLDGVFVDANDVALELSGFSIEEFRQARFEQMLLPEHRERAVAAFEAALAREPQQLEATMVTKDGLRMELNLAAVPIVVNDEVVGVHGTAENITEENELRRELERTRRAAEEANAAKSLFLANMSHEVRTPLTSVLGATELLADGTLDAQQERLVEIVHRSGEKLLRLVNDILDVSRLEQGTVEVQEAPFVLPHLVEDALSWASPMAERERLYLVASISEDVPERLVGDAFRITQVVTNLLGNALKFTEEGQVALHVSVARSRGDAVDLRLVVEDTGIGIPTDQLAFLFESFTQVDTSTTRTYGGAGLGLAICQELVSLMGGTISAASTPGEGTAFTVVLPLRVPDPELFG